MYTSTWTKKDKWNLAKVYAHNDSHKNHQKALGGIKFPNKEFNIQYSYIKYKNTNFISILETGKKNVNKICPEYKISIVFLKWKIHVILSSDNFFPWFNI